MINKKKSALSFVIAVCVLLSFMLYQATPMHLHVYDHHHHGDAAGQETAHHAQVHSIYDDSHAAHGHNVSTIEVAASVDGTMPNPLKVKLLVAILAVVLTFSGLPVVRRHIRLPLQQFSIPYRRRSSSPPPLRAPPAFA